MEQAASSIFIEIYYPQQWLINGITTSPNLMKWSFKISRFDSQ